MKVYKVWSLDNGDDEADAQQIVAVDARYAAQEYTQATDEGDEDGTEIEVYTKDQEGTVRRWHVRKSMHVQYLAAEVER